MEDGRPGGASLPLGRQSGRPGGASLPRRKWLGHAVPAWVDQGIFFITITCRPCGETSLIVEPVADVIHDTAIFYHGVRWWIHIWLTMPDHVHALMSFPHNESMIKVVSDWKRFVRNKTGVKWQKGFFDHRLRKDESFAEKASYIRMNPVRAGLVKEPDQWAHTWSFDDSVSA